MWFVYMILILLQVESLPSMVKKIWSMDSNMQLDATTQFRKLLSKGKRMLLSCFKLLIGIIRHLFVEVNLINRTKPSH